jgi:hypothetical protein
MSLILEQKAIMTPIGYKELFPYFENKETLENCIEKCKQNSRKYAKDNTRGLIIKWMLIGLMLILIILIKQLMKFLILLKKIINIIKKAIIIAFFNYPNRIIVKSLWTSLLAINVSFVVVLISCNVNGTVVTTNKAFPDILSVNAGVLAVILSPADVDIVYDIVGFTVDPSTANHQFA